MTMTSSKILIVEDNPEQAKALKQALESLGYTVFGPALDCSAALELIWRDKPDIAFVDTHLGSETCEVVLDECDQQSIPVIITLEEAGNIPHFCGRRDQFAGKPDIAKLQAVFG